MFAGVGGLVVSYLDLQVERRGFESRSDREFFQTIGTPSWVEYKVDRVERNATNSGTNWAYVINESKARLAPVSSD